MIHPLSSLLTTRTPPLPLRHRAGVTAIAVSNGSGRIISGGGDGLVRVWRLGPQSQTLLESMKEHKVWSRGEGGGECVCCGQCACVLWVVCVCMHVGAWISLVVRCCPLLSGHSLFDGRLGVVRVFLHPPFYSILSVCLPLQLRVFVACLRLCGAQGAVTDIRIRANDEECVSSR